MNILIDEYWYITAIEAIIAWEILKVFFNHVCKNYFKYLVGIVALILIYIFFYNDLDLYLQHHKKPKLFIQYNDDDTEYETEVEQ